MALPTNHLAFNPPILTREAVAGKETAADAVKNIG
jgi:hypothetical protein